MQDEESDDDMYDEDTTSNGDFEKKADTAEDFSDIKELAEDLQTPSQVCNISIKPIYVTNCTIL